MVKHHLPSSLNEALLILHNEEVTIIAGGTDLMVQRRTWADTPPKFDCTMNIINVSELDYIEVKENKLHIGATTSLTSILEHEFTPILLKKAIEVIASPALRNIATVAGNIGNASPAGDTLPILYVLDAEIKLRSLSGKRILPIQEVILGPRKTVIQKDELISEIILPLESFTTTSFVKVGGRKADAISKISFTGAATINEGILEDLRICFGAVGPVMVRKPHIEHQYKKKPLQQVKNELDAMIQKYSEFITPINDQRSNIEYRKQVANNLLRDFIRTL